MHANIRGIQQCTRNTSNINSEIFTCIGWCMYVCMCACVCLCICNAYGHGKSLYVRLTFIKYLKRIFFFLLWWKKIFLHMLICIAENTRSGLLKIATCWYIWIGIVFLLFSLYLRQMDLDCRIFCGNTITLYSSLKLQRVDTFG